MEQQDSRRAARAGRGSAIIKSCRHFRTRVFRGSSSTFLRVIERGTRLDIIRVEGS